MTATRYALLLRGVNIGGNRKMKMADLRELLEGLGHAQVATYLQSGNAVFSAAGKAADEAMASQIEHAMADHFGFHTHVMVRTGAELAAVCGANPFGAEAAADPKKVHALFLGGDVDPDRLAALDLGRFAPEAVVTGDRVLYLHLPSGMGRSKLAPVLTDKRLGVLTTARNWRTVSALAEMTAGG